MPYLPELVPEEAYNICVACQVRAARTNMSHKYVVAATATQQQQQWSRDLQAQLQITPARR
jgi:hypothetical protein